MIVLFSSTKLLRMLKTRFLMILFIDYLSNLQRAEKNEIRLQHSKSLAFIHKFVTPPTIAEFSKLLIFSEEEHYCHYLSLVML